jgi:hypothetical protein
MHESSEQLLSDCRLLANVVALLHPGLRGVQLEIVARDQVYRAIKDDARLCMLALLSNTCSRGEYLNNSFDLNYSGSATESSK